MLAVILIIILTCVAIYKLNKALNEETGTFVDATEPLERLRKQLEEKHGKESFTEALRLIKEEREKREKREKGE